MTLEQRAPGCAGCHCRPPDTDTEPLKRRLPLCPLCCRRSRRFQPQTHTPGGNATLPQPGAAAGSVTPSWLFGFHLCLRDPLAPGSPCRAAGEGGCGPGSRMGPCGRLPGAEEPWPALDGARDPGASAISLLWEAGSWLSFFLLWPRAEV